MTVATNEPAGHTYLASTIVTMQIGAALGILLGLMFLSGGMFYLYVFNYDIGPYFTATRVVHFYAGLASIPFLLAKYGATGLRFAGYYLRLPQFKRAGPPAIGPRLLSPLLALDFFVLYFSGLYMLFHYYYIVGNIPPFQFQPVQLHLWAAMAAVPLLAAHLGWHLLDTIHGLTEQRRALRLQEQVEAGVSRPMLTRRGFVATVAAGGAGLALGFQNTPLANAEIRGLVIGRIPEAERGGPGAFPVETLFGKGEVDISTWRLRVGGATARELALSYAELLALPAVTARIRISCVSGWSAQPEWTGPRVRDVLALAGAHPGAKRIDVRSMGGYHLAWHRGRLLGDRAILATHVNGAPLSVNHGFPVRLIVPGYPGQNMIKQIGRLDVRTEPERFAPMFRLFG